MQQPGVGRILRLHAQRSLHLRHLCSVEAVGLQIRQAPVVLAIAGLEFDAPTVDRFAFRSSAQRLEQVALRHHHARWPARIQLQRPLIRAQCIFLAQSSRQHGSQHDPIQRRVRFDEQRMSNGLLRFCEPSRLHQGLAESAPYQRQMRRLTQRIAQHALRLRGLFSHERDRGKAAQRAHVFALLPEDVAENPLRALRLRSGQVVAGSRDGGTESVGLRRASEGRGSLHHLVRIDQRIAKQAPGGVHGRIQLHRSAQGDHGFLRSGDAAQQRPQIGVHMCGIRRNVDGCLKCGDTFRRFVLALQDQREQPQSLNIGGIQRQQFAQQPFGRIGFPLAEVGQR